MLPGHNNSCSNTKFLFVSFSLFKCGKTRILALEMSEFDAPDGCVISKTKEDNEASSQIATQPCDDSLSESFSYSYAEQDKSYEEEDPVS